MPPTDSRALEAAAKAISACMNYPWEFMPEQGRNTMRQHAKTVIDAALSAAPQSDGWRPIAEAPKGRNVLVGYWNRLGKWRTVKACYYPPQTLELHEDHDWDEDSDGFAPEGWYEETETHEVTLPLECEPVRWMPLPTPPKMTQTEGQSHGE